MGSLDPEIIDLGKTGTDLANLQWFFHFSKESWAITMRLSSEESR